MPAQDVQQLIDLLALSPDVTELSVQSAEGGRVTIKRKLTVLETSEIVPYAVQTESAEISQEVIHLEKAVPPLSVNATLVGLFHATNPPIAPGATVVSGQIVGYIESMRLMNEVVSTIEGVVESAVATDGQPVEYGQPLIIVKCR
jgi:biotin carboxyl carrier protein